MIWRYLSVLIIIFSLSSYGEDGSIRYEVKIIEKIVVDIAKKSNPKVCVVDYPASNIQQYSSVLVLTNCSQADIIISSSEKVNDHNKPIILIGSQNFGDGDVIGSIFWRKGRPQIIFIEKNIKKFDIQLPEEYRKYILRKESLINAKADS